MLEFNFNKNDVIEAEGTVYRIDGKIMYKNVQDGSQWSEYLLAEESTHCKRWLSIDPIYEECAIYEMQRKPIDTDEIIQRGYREADSGVQVVVGKEGWMDVDLGEKASYWEYEDQSTENIIAVEKWSDGKEYSTGHYVKPESIRLLYKMQGVKENKSGFTNNTKYGVKGLKKWLIVAVFVAFNLFAVIMAMLVGGNQIKKYLEDQTNIYTYRTSVTSDIDTKKKADVYVSIYNLDMTARDIIDGIEGDTAYVQQNTEDGDDSIAIITDDEYCIIYTSDDDETLVQVSSRSYVYSSSNSLYRGRAGSNRYYRRYYYSTAYKTDKNKYKKQSDSFSGYDDTSISSYSGDTYSSYSSSVRQSSIAARRSSGGSSSFGK